MPSITSRIWFRPLVIGAVSAGLAVILIVAGALERLEGWTYDWRMNLTRANTHIDSQVAVILIDDNSLQTLDPIVGRWPWPRSIYAELLDFLSLGEPKAVIFDITFHEKQLTQHTDSIDDHDFRLVEATSNYPFVYHAARFLVDQEDEANKSLLNRPLPEGSDERFGIQSRMTKWDFTSIVDISSAPSNNVYYLPFSELLEVTPNIGVVDVNGDHDGVIRRARLFHRYKESLFPALSTAVFIDEFKPKILKENEGMLEFGPVKLPFDRDGRFLVNYYDHYDTYSFGGAIASWQQIQRGELDKLLIDPDLFKNKIVFVGASAAGLEDLKITPMDSRLPGVLIHASIASNLLDKKFLTPPEHGLTYLLTILLAFATSFGVLLSKKPWQQNSIPVALMLGFSTWAVYQFFELEVVEMVAPLAGTLASWIGSFSLLVFTEGKEKRKFKRMMSQYLSPAVLATVIDNRDEIAKAGVGSRENISILFSDIRGFTTLSEQLTAEKVVEILNHYFSKMTGAIFQHEGTIDKFIGDAIMAFWGAPIRTNNHADKAVHAAIEMINRLAEVNGWLSEQGYPNLAIGIGIHTGEVIQGNIGSEHKIEYTIIGDNVNLASRMEGLTKTYDSPILITESTYKQFQQNLPCRAVDFVKVKGKHKPIKIYQPICPAILGDQAAKNATQLADLSEKAFELYLNRQWQQAITTFQQLPDDYITKTMIERCQFFMNNPPDPEWDGSHTMKTK